MAALPARAANSMLLQVLYFLQEAHVRYLLRQYRDAFIDVHGANAVPRERDAPLPAPDGTRARGTAARTRLPFDHEPFKVEDEPENDVDMNNDAPGSDFDHKGTFHDFSMRKSEK